MKRILTLLLAVTSIGTLALAGSEPVAGTVTSSQTTINPTTTQQSLLSPELKPSVDYTKMLFTGLPESISFKMEDFKPADGGLMIANKTLGGIPTEIALFTVDMPLIQKEMEKNNNTLTINVRNTLINIIQRDANNNVVSLMVPIKTAMTQNNTTLCNNHVLKATGNLKGIMYQFDFLTSQSIPVSDQICYFTLYFKDDSIELICPEKDCEAFPSNNPNNPTIKGKCKEFYANTYTNINECVCSEELEFYSIRKGVGTAKVWRRIN